tara:strand:- start:37 stop:219 length:183 start_codon:yes stop_codon:yes gene_type:complete
MVSYQHTENNIEFIYYYDVFIKLWTVIKYKNDYHLETEYYNTKQNLKLDNPDFKFIKEGK